MLAFIALAVTAPMEMGAVMNIDMTSEATFRRHFEVAQPWASYVRVSVAMDQEGWKPDIEKLPFVRNRRLAQECRKRGWGMDVHLGGVPHPEAWSALGKPRGGYSGQRLREMPREWWPKWADYQREAAKAIVEAYGPEAPNKIRFQLFNEPYDRGEDALADELMSFLVARITRKGKVFGCPLDGPSLWGKPDQMSRQMDRFAKLMRSDLTLGQAIQKVPISMYPIANARSERDPDLLAEEYVGEAQRTVREAETTLGRPVYFSEAGVGRVYDVRYDIFGARTNELAERALIRTLQGFRRAGFQHVTLYQTKDDTEADARGYGYGLADRHGRLRVDLDALARIARGEL